MNEDNGQPKEIYGRMASILSAVEAISKGRQNAEQHYKFRGIDDVYNMLHPLLSEHKVFCLPRMLAEETSERTTAKGTVLRFVKLTMAYDFFAPDGSSVTAEVVGEAMDAGDKAANKAMSAAHKYALLQTFCIPTGDAVDSEQDTYEVEPGGKAASRSNAAPEPCPDCSGPMWDNRETKTGRQPDFKCKDKGCNKAVWLEDKPKETPEQVAIRELMAQAEKLLPPTSKKLAEMRSVTDPNELGRKVQILIDLKREKEAAFSANTAALPLDVRYDLAANVRASFLANGLDEAQYLIENYDGAELSELSIEQLNAIDQDINIPF